LGGRPRCRHDPRPLRMGGGRIRVGSVGSLPACSRCVPKTRRKGPLTISRVGLKPVVAGHAESWLRLATEGPRRSQASPRSMQRSAAERLRCVQGEMGDATPKIELNALLGHPTVRDRNMRHQDACSEQRKRLDEILQSPRQSARYTGQRRHSVIARTCPPTWPRCRFAACPASAICTNPRTMLRASTLSSNVIASLRARADYLFHTRWATQREQHRSDHSDMIAVVGKATDLNVFSALPLDPFSGAGLRELSHPSQHFLFG